MGVLSSAWTALVDVPLVLSLRKVFSNSGSGVA
jgi:hypothetical protein